jgi:hypothetical protein
MVIVGDWMPVKILVNDQGTFTDLSAQFGLSETEGWWHVIVAKDINRDGFMDFILGNHGLNSFFRASVKQPVTLYVNDFDLNGTIEQILCTYNKGVSYPLVMKDDLVKQIPSLAAKYRKFDDYKNQTMADIFPSDILGRSLILHARIMESCVMIHNGRGGYKLVPLPAEAQFTPVYALLAHDFDDDGRCDIVIGGNQYRAKPETGIFDAGYGLFLKGDAGSVWRAVPPEVSGIFTKGEIRDLEILKINGSRIMMVARNNDNLQFYKY